METVIKDLNQFERDELSGYYGGKSGFKYGIIIDGERWIVKFPESTKGFPGQEKRNPHIPSYTTSPLSEYIGSQIYASLGIPVHETMLGLRGNKIVVACKDFNPNHELVEFGNIKNSVEEVEAALIGSSGSSSTFQGEYLRDVLTVIDHSKLLQRVDGIRERFWDMFVVDGFIRNNDRNNGNWGVLLKKDGTVEMAPVYDNGNAFFNKRNPSVSERRVLSEADIKQDALGTNISFFLADDNSHIHPFQYIESLQDSDCTAALIRFSERVDMEAIRGIVDGIPERAFGLDVISPAQKEHYVQMMETIIERSVNPTLERIGRSPVSLHRSREASKNGRVTLRGQEADMKRSAQALEDGHGEPQQRGKNNIDR